MVIVIVENFIIVSIMDMVNESQKKIIINMLENGLKENNMEMEKKYEVMEAIVLRII